MSGRLVDAYTDSEDEDEGHAPRRISLHKEERMYLGVDRISRSPQSHSSGSPIGKEPPPPRPNIHDGSPGSTLNTPSRYLEKLTRIGSGIALVSAYEAEPAEHDAFLAEEEVEAHDEDMEVVEEESAGSPAHEAASSGDRLEVPQAKRAGSDLDVDEYLERALEGGSVADASPRTPESVEGGEKVKLSSRGEVELPPPVSARCSAKLQAKFDELLRTKRETGASVNVEIQKRKDFRNPCIYEKLVEHLKIDETGSNFAREIFDPHGFKPCDYYEEIAKAQKVLMDKETAKQAAVGSPVSQSQPLPGARSSLLVDDKKRKSKWDNPGGGGSGPVGAPSLPHSASAGSIQVSSTTTVTIAETKTVIFGKKSKLV